MSWNHSLSKAEQIGTDTKSKELLSGLEQGFAQLAEMGAAKKSSSSRSRCELNSTLHIFWKTMATREK